MQEEDDTSHYDGNNDIAFSIKLSPLISRESVQDIINFEALDLGPQRDTILRNLRDMHYIVPTAIQKKALPILLNQVHPNVIAQSKSGTGKTGAFALALARNCSAEHAVNQAIVVAPTRELAVQISQVLGAVLKDTGLRVYLALSGGERFEHGQTLPGHIIVGTPGVTIGHVRQGRIQLPTIRMFILDEADKMLKEGLSEICRDIRSALSPRTQMMLFSATFYGDVLSFARDYAMDTRQNVCEILLAESELAAVRKIKQWHIRCHPLSKLDVIKVLYDSVTDAQSIIFCNTRNDVNRLYQLCTDDLGFPSSTIAILHGERSQAERDAAVQHFRKGPSVCRVIITSAVMERGLDFPDVNLVVNYSPPTVYQPNGRPRDPVPDIAQYTHRVGRTGRNNKNGHCVNLADGDTSDRIFDELEQSYNKKVRATLIVADDKFKLMEALSFTQG